MTAHSLLSEGEIYARIGEDGFHRLVAAFYAQVPGDDILGAMYPADDLPGAEERLRDFLVGRFGGPRRYEEARGHPRLRMRHMPFKLNQAARDRWVAADGPRPGSGGITGGCGKILRDFFHHMATFMINTPT